MTHERPNQRWKSWPARLVVSMFLLVVGGMANQFWNIPVQQMHQDDRLNALEKHMEYNDQRLDRYEKQNDIMMRQLEDIKKIHEDKQPTRRKGGAN